MAALETFKKERSEDWQVMGVALASHALGRQQDYEKALNELRDGWGEQWPTEVAQVYAWIGDTDQAFAWLQKGHDLHGDGSWPNIRIDDLLAPIHDDPRWPGYANKLGISDADLRNVQFSITLPKQ
jgi:hypothetical protein